MSGTSFTVEVQPRIPERLSRLAELANDLLYSWDRQVRALFYRLDRDLWEACGHNPKVFLRRVSQKRLLEAEKDRGFIEDYNLALSAYDTYHREGLRSGLEQMLDPEHDLVAYFCAEFGLHESFPLYSGGLGILAGDHCKAASDLGLPFVGIGLLYRRGYFTQTIDNHGNQIAHYTPTKFNDLPIQPAVGSNGEEIHVQVDLSERQVTLKLWQAKAGHITLYLLDSDLPVNSEQDRSITYQLYGGDKTTRIQQEIVLGIGGVRALRALGKNPTIWHINEGHAAFQILERCREHVVKGMDFDSAIELVASATAFTTHTPVAAGHDIFDKDLITTYFRDYLKQLKIDSSTFSNLGESPIDSNGFNMTALALRGSRFHNGVSRIHGGVASNMEAYIWPQTPKEENPITYVTNGVHLPTFLAREWVSLLDTRFSDWRGELLNPEYWQNVMEQIPDHRCWSLRQELKSAMLQDVQRRVLIQSQRNGCSDAHIKRICQHLIKPQEDVLVLGFARRFATYKRATLLLSDPERLSRLLNDSNRPVLIIFSGKAHPNDIPGQQLIKSIHDYAERPEFQGKIIFLEGYDMALARKLVTGVDVWLNTPQYPLEASGTSGEKAAINGVLNLSVLDGWWGEGYDGDNGWAITPHGSEFDAEYRDREEAHDLMDILEKEVIPLYYDRDHKGYSEGWVRKCKASMQSIIPRFNAMRMVMDYVTKLYTPAKNQHQKLAANNGAQARELASWKQKIRKQWSGVRVKGISEAPQAIEYDEKLPLSVKVFLNGLAADDVAVECLIGTQREAESFKVLERFFLKPQNNTDSGETIYSANEKLQHSGLQSYKIRIYPYHSLLSHRFEIGYMLWL